MTKSVAERKNYDRITFIFVFFLMIETTLKGLSHEIDFKNVDNNLQNLA